MKKIFFSVLISLILTVFIAELIKDKFKEKWYLSISYEHIDRKIDLNYMLLKDTISNVTEENFHNFVTNLTHEIISKTSLNACTKVRGDQKNPNILIKFSALNLDISMFANDKENLLDCEKYIDEKIDNLNKLNNEYLKRMIAAKKNIFNFDKNEKIDVFLANLLSNVLNPKILNEISNIDKNNFKQIELLSEVLELANNINDNLTTYNRLKIFSEDINNFMFVEKEFSDLSKKKENKFLLYFSIFIILQLLQSLIIFMNNKKFINKIKIILNKI